MADRQFPIQRDDTERLNMATNLQSFEFLRLPAELKYAVYQFVLPARFEIDVELHPSQLRPLSEEIEDMTNDSLKDCKLNVEVRGGGHNGDDFVKRLSTAIVLLKTCRSIHLELGHMLYSRVQLRTYVILATGVFASQSGNLAASIKHFSFTCNNVYEMSTTEHERRLAALVGFLSGSEQSLCVVNGETKELNSRRAELGDSAWELEELQRMRTVLGHSRRFDNMFRQVYYLLDRRVATFLFLPTGYVMPYFPGYGKYRWRSEAEIRRSLEIGEQLVVGENVYEGAQQTGS